MPLIITEPHDLGVLTIDHRHASAPPPPGLGKLVEVPTYTCSHCQRIVVMNPERKRERAKCSGCNHLICDGCGAARAAGSPCKTFAQVVDEYLNSLAKET